MITTTDSTASKTSKTQGMIRWWGLGAFIIVTLLTYLSIDTLLELGIEKAGSQAVGAKVELNSASLSLLPLGIELSGLAVTNPDHPMENLLTSEQITLALNSGRLWQRQVIIEQARVAGLQFNTPRQYSGALTSNAKTTEQAVAAGSGFGLDLSLPDPKALINAEKTVIQAKYKAIEEEIKAIEARWEQNIAELPDKQQLDSYKQRWEALKKKDMLQKLVDLKALKKDVKTDLKTIKQLRNELDTDTARIKTLIKQAQQLPEQEADRLLAKAGYQGGSKALSQQLMGGEVKQWLSKITQLFTTLSKTDNTAQEPEHTQPSRGQGQWISFTETTPHPDLLIKQANVSGSFLLSNNLVSFTGHIDNISNQPKRWHLPTQFELKGEAKLGGQFTSKGRIDLRSAPNSQMTASVSQMTLEQLTLSPSSSLNIKQAKVDGTLNAKLVANTIDLLTKAEFQALQFDSSKATEKLNSLQQALSTIDAFELTATLTGSSENPDFAMRSNLDKVLGSALKSQASEKIEQYKLQLKDQLLEEFASENSSLNARSDVLGDISKQLDNKTDAINTFSKGLL